MMFATKRPVLVIGALGLGSLLLVAYWITFYTSGDVQVATDTNYLSFQKSFLLADAWLTACCLMGAVGLWFRREWGFLFGLLAASSSLFLVLMDVCFNLNEGIYLRGGWEVRLEILINVYSLTVGVFVTTVLWQNRADLCPGNRTASARA